MIDRRPAALLILGLGATLAGCREAFDVQENQGNDSPAGATPTPTAPLLGQLEISPARMDFGPVGVGCRAFQDLTVRNIGRTPVRVFGISAEIDPAVFLVDDRTGTLEFLDAWTFPVAFVPTGATPTSYGEVWVQSDDTHAQLRKVELAGGVQPGAERVDVLHQGAASPADFLWVMDASSSMDEDIDRVLASFSDFVDGLYEQGVNYHMGFVTMDIPHDYGELRGSYGPDGLPYITPEMGDAAIEELLDTMDAEAGNNDDDTEAGLEAVARCLNDGSLADQTGFLREGARLVIVVLSDDEDQSTGDVALYRNELVSLKGGDPDVISFHGIIATSDNELNSAGGCADAVGERYMDMIYSFDGVFDSVCSSDYGDILSTVGSFDQADLTDTFPLSAPPLLSSGIRVTLGSDTSSTRTDTVEGEDWVYSAAQNAVVFQPDHLPPAAARVEIAYTDAGACTDP